MTATAALLSTGFLRGSRSPNYSQEREMAQIILSGAANGLDQLLADVRQGNSVALHPEEIEQLQNHANRARTLLTELEAAPDHYRFTREFSEGVWGLYRLSKHMGNISANLPYTESNIHWACQQLTYSGVVRPEGNLEFEQHVREHTFPDLMQQVVGALEAERNHVAVYTHGKKSAALDGLIERINNAMEGLNNGQTMEQILAAHQTDFTNALSFLEAGYARHTNNIFQLRTEPDQLRANYWRGPASALGHFMNPAENVMPQPQTNPELNEALAVCTNYTVANKAQWAIDSLLLNVSKLAQVVVGHGRE